MSSSFARAKTTPARNVVVYFCLFCLSAVSFLGLDRWYAFAGGLAQAFAAGSLAQAFTAPHAFAGGLAQALVLALCQESLSTGRELSETPERKSEKEEESQVDSLAKKSPALEYIPSGQP
jgi:hypothetical protein